MENSVKNVDVDKHVVVAAPVKKANNMTVIMFTVFITLSIVTGLAVSLFVVVNNKDKSTDNIVAESNSLVVSDKVDVDSLTSDDFDLKWRIWI